MRAPLQLEAEDFDLGGGRLALVDVVTGEVQQLKLARPLKQIVDDVGSRLGGLCA